MGCSSIPGAGIFYLIKQAGAGYLLAQTVPPHFIHYFSSNPAGLRCPVFAAGRNVLLFVLDLNPPAALVAVPPRLRRRPHTGALNHRLLLLFAGCLQPQKLTLSIPAQSPGEGEVRSPEPPYGGGGAAAGEPLEGGWVGLDHPHGRAISLPPPHPPCASRFGRSCPRAAGPAGRAPAGHKRKIPAPGMGAGIS